MFQGLLHRVGNFYEFNEEILTLSTINVVCGLHENSRQLLMKVCMNITLPKSKRYVRLLILVDMYNWFQEKYCPPSSRRAWVTHQCNSCTSAQNSLFPFRISPTPCPRGLVLYRKMEVSNLSEKLLYIFQITRRHIPQDRNFYRPLGWHHLTCSL